MRSVLRRQNNRLQLTAGGGKIDAGRS